MLTFRLSALLAGLLAAASSAKAGIFISSVLDNPASGYNRWLVSAASDGEKITVFDIAFAASDLNNLSPGGVNTTFQDNNGAITGAGQSVSLDTQFRYLSSSLYVVPTGTMTTPLGSFGRSQEGTVNNLDYLQGTFGKPGGFSSPQTFAQIVAPTGVSVSYYGVIADLLGNEFLVQGTLQAATPPELIGDANGDCTVGAADYALWAAQFGQSGGNLSADFDGNGSVGAGDYALWAANFGNTCPPSGSTSVPEPASWILLSVALAALGCRRLAG